MTEATEATEATKTTEIETMTEKTMQTIEVTDEEKLVIEIFRACESAEFRQFECTFKEALEFTDMLGVDTRPFSVDGSNWFRADNGKIKLVGFLK